jgi:hypothetical protein
MRGAATLPPPHGRPGGSHEVTNRDHRSAVDRVRYGRSGAGYQSTEHDVTPFGDLVVDVGTTLSQATDGRGPATTTFIVTPAFRTHMGRDWYLLAGIDVPVTSPQPYDFQPTVG